MRRRNAVQHQEHVNHERWLVSYADFITLLFAFFVVMYSLSQLSDTEFNAVSDSLRVRFSNNTTIYNKLMPADLGPTAATTQLSGDEVASEADNVELTPAVIDQVPEYVTKLPKPLEHLQTTLSHDLQETIKNNQIGIFGSEQWLEIDMSAEVLFEEGRSELTPSGRLLIEYMVEQLKDIPNAIRVEGFTDDKSLPREKGQSNWALSSMRSVAVAELMQKLGVDPSRIAAVGYGQYQPITSNSSKLGQTANRRIALVVSESASPRQGRAGFKDLTEEENVTLELNSVKFRGWIDEVSEALGKVAAPEERPDPVKIEGVNIIRKEDGGLIITNENQ